MNKQELILCNSIYKDLKIGKNVNVSCNTENIDNLIEYVRSLFKELLHLTFNKEDLTYTISKQFIQINNS